MQNGNTNYKGRKKRCGLICYDMIEIQSNLIICIKIKSSFIKTTVKNIKIKNRYYYSIDLSDSFIFINDLLD